ncbi:MAG TPA: DUF1440 domain-containing protein [Clostridia bacterium]|nr:DUF1440 domain-containing protein [Clostridia bacterium]
MRNHTNADAKAIAKGLAAGLLGGLVASFAMNMLMSVAARGTNAKREGMWNDPQRDKQLMRERVTYFQQLADPTGEASQRAWWKISGHELTPEQRRKAGPVVHYAFGALLGAAYGAAAEVAPMMTKGMGAPFGVAVWAVGDEIAVPALGLSPWPTEVPAEAHAAMFASHVLYGASLEGVRRMLRRKPSQRYAFSANIGRVA